MRSGTSLYVVNARGDSAAFLWLPPCRQGTLVIDQNRQIRRRSYPEFHHAETSPSAPAVFGTIDDMTDSEPVLLVVSAHAGDFVWRAGGAIAAATQRGERAVIVCLSY